MAKSPPPTLYNVLASNISLWSLQWNSVGSTSPQDPTSHTLTCLLILAVRTCLGLVETFYDMRSLADDKGVKTARLMLDMVLATDFSP